MSLIEKAVEKKKSETGASPRDESTGDTKTHAAETAAAFHPQPSPPIDVDRGDINTPRPAPASAEAPSKIDIDFNRLASIGVMSPERTRNRLAEEFRVVKRSLLESAMDPQRERGNLIMITSAAPAEGKTHVALNLALSLTKEVDLFVLLIDADLSRPAVLTRLGLEKDQIENQKGLTDLLDSRDLDVSDVIMRTSIPNLSIIPSGRRHPLGTELLASKRAKDVIDEIATRYPNRIVVFDTAPVLASSEGGALVSRVGQIVFVVEAEKTKEEAVLEGLDHLGSDQKVSIVLNKIKTRFLIGGPSGYYGGYYQQYSSQ